MMLLFALLVPFAAGSSARDAEALRLESEIERLSQKRVWSGVERTYQRLLELKEVSITPHTHLSAAHAAQEQGDIRAAWERARRAAGVAGAEGDAQALERASSWMADFYANYGQVEIEVAVSWKEPLEIRSRDATFSPTARLVLDHAQAQLNTQRAFTGFLPLGRYAVGGTDFDVVGRPLERVFVKPGRTGVAAPAPSVEAVPVATEPEVPDRIVVLAVRGGGWPADAWAPLSTSARDHLYKVEGVRAVDVFGPDDPWLVVRIDPEKLAAVRPPLTPEEIAAILARTLELPTPVVTEGQIAVLPGASSPAALLAASVGSGEPPLTLADLAVVEATDPGPVPVPADTSAVARWRLELRVAGTDGVLERLVPAASSPEGADQLGFTLEGPAAR